MLFIEWAELCRDLWDAASQRLPSVDVIERCWQRHEELLMFVPSSRLPALYDAIERQLQVGARLSLHYVISIARQESYQGNVAEGSKHIVHYDGSYDMDTTAEWQLLVRAKQLAYQTHRSWVDVLTELRSDYDGD